MKNQIIIYLLVAIATWPHSSNSAPRDSDFQASAVYLFNVVSEANTTTTDFDEGNGFAGYIGYKVLPYLSIEVGGVDFDTIKGFEEIESTTARTEYKVSGYSVGVKGGASFNDLFDIWGSIGQYNWDSTFNYDITYANFPALNRSGGDENSGSDIYLRIGLSTSITDNINFMIEVSQYELSDFFSDSTGSNTDFEQRFIGIGVEANFW